MTNGATQAAAPDTEPARSRRRCRGLALTAGLRLEARFDCPDSCGQLQRKGKAAHLIPAEQAVACTLPYTGPAQRLPDEDRKSVVEGKSVSVRVDLGGRRIPKK